jgi:hypothetical protein
VDDHVIAFGNDRTRLISQRRWRAPDQIEQVVAPGLDMRAVLNIGVRPEVRRRFIVAFVEERVESLSDWAVSPRGPRACSTHKSDSDPRTLLAGTSTSATSRNVKRLPLVASLNYALDS